MTSRITIEVDLDKGQPYIKVINDTASDDVRDKLITFFRQQFGHTSAWCRVEHAQYPATDRTGICTFFIRPIRPAQMEEEAKAMQEQVEMLKKYPEQAAVSH